MRKKESNIFKICKTTVFYPGKDFMPSSILLINKSINIISTIFIVIFLGFVLDFINAGFLIGNFGIFSLLVYVPLKVYLFAGIYGSVLDIVYGEEYVLGISNFNANAKKFWKLYCGCLILPFILFILIQNVSFFGFRVRLADVIYFSNVFVISFFIYYAAKIKYVSLSKKGCCTILDLFVILFCLCVEAILYFLDHYFALYEYLPGNFVVIGRLYVHFFEFIYIAHLFCNYYALPAGSNAEEKELFIINPAGGGILNYFGSFFLRTYPPIFLVLKALTPKYYRIREFNRVMWHKRYFKKGVLVAITSFSSNSPDSYYIAKEFKKLGAKVIMGGPHVSFLPREALEFCDSVVVGDCTSVWPEIIRDYEHNCLKKEYRGVFNSGYPLPIHEELMKAPLAEVKDFLETTRGCKFRCDFCTVPAICGSTINSKPISEVLELLSRFKGKYKLINFIDNNIFCNPQYAKELFKAMPPLNLKWVSQCTIDIAADEEALKLAKQAGCIGLLIGYEINASSLEKDKKGKLSLADKYIEYTKKIKKAGINIKAHFIFGFEDDNFLSLFKLWIFCLRINPAITVISFLTPFPGTKIYSDMLGAARIESLNWRNYSCQNQVFKHKNINSLFSLFVYPLIYVFFLFTTSKVGYLLVIIAIFVLSFD